MVLDPATEPPPPKILKISAPKPLLDGVCGSAITCTVHSGPWAAPESHWCHQVSKERLKITDVFLVEYAGWLGNVANGFPRENRGDPSWRRLPFPKLPPKAPDSTSASLRSRQRIASTRFLPQPSVGCRAVAGHISPDRATQALEKQKRQTLSRHRTHQSIVPSRGPSDKPHH